MKNLWVQPFIVKMGSTSEIEIFIIFSNFYYRDSSKTQWIRKWKWHFPSKWGAKLPNLNGHFQWALTNSALVENSVHAILWTTTKMPSKLQIGANFCLDQGDQPPVYFWAQLPGTTESWSLSLGKGEERVFVMPLREVIKNTDILRSGWP